MTIRLSLWLGAMTCAVLLLGAVGALTPLVADSFVLASAVVLAVFAPIAWMLARLVFHPVRDVAKTTRSITTTGELDRRCVYAGPRDDVGDLVVAVNDLLVRYDAAIGRIQRLRAAPPHCACPRPASLPDAADLVLELGPRADSDALTSRRSDRADEAAAPN
jgi:hypothetical protein